MQINEYMKKLDITNINNNQPDNNLHNNNPHNGNQVNINNNKIQPTNLTFPFLTFIFHTHHCFLYKIMSRKCTLTGTKIQTGNNVSNSNHKVRRIFAPNLQTVSLRSDLLNKTFQMKITTRTIRTISKYGSLDAYLLHTKANNMTEFGARLKKQLKQIPEVQQTLQREAETHKAKRIIYASARSKLKKTAEA